jgi:putative PIN family toxin of toxin-antitoxin system
VKKVFAEYDLFVSPELLGEYREVPLSLERGGKIDHEQLKALLAGIAVVVSTAVIVRPHKRLHVCRDAADNMVLECCQEAGARVLVTGDKDLLELDTSALSFSLQICSPRQFIEQ